MHEMITLSTFGLEICIHYLYKDLLFLADNFNFNIRWSYNNVIINIYSNTTWSKHYKLEYNIKTFHNDMSYVLYRVSIFRLATEDLNYHCIFKWKTTGYLSHVLCFASKWEFRTHISNVTQKNSTRIGGIFYLFIEM